ncbi:uncharacterized protein LOC132038444 [Lycium ferocissimum]|uniref:uncharacterized protein LOC132038444 n=1 Tax=Lycium ferocissimum TaxID=112874 RepID=UPI002814E424|nr:uncharacterized protein LOC132038444 [Lycium ferocissimum]
MSDSHSVNFQVEPSHHEHDGGDAPDHDAPPVNPAQVGSSVGNMPVGEDNGAVLQQLQNQLDMAMAQLQAPDVTPAEPTQDEEERQVLQGNDGLLGQNIELKRMLMELTKRVESGEKKIEANDKKVENYNSRVDQIPGAPPVLKGQDSKKFVQMPFPSSVAPMKIPKRFRMPDIPKYSGTTDPNEHVTAYTCAIKGNDLADDERESVLLKKFGETLSKGAMLWYHNLPEHSIDSFAMLADAFVKAHAGAIKVETRKSDLFNVKQRDDETLREFVARFQMERMDLPPVTDDWAVQAFTQGLNSRSSITSMELKQNLIEYPAIAWADVHNRYQSKIRVEDDKILRAASVSWHSGKGIDHSKRVVDRDSRSSYDRNFSCGREPEQRNEASEAHPIPGPKRDKSLICRYHHTHGHRTEDCRQLREEVARLFNLGHLREFLSERAKTHFKNLDSNKPDRPEEPHQVIHMIMGGTDMPVGPVMKCTKISITREKRVRGDDPEGAIKFDDEDMEGIAQPHNDALVISILVNNVRIKRVLIDPSSSANIIRWRVVEQLGLLDQIVPAIRVLNGFNMACETTKDEITLPISMAGVVQHTKFYVTEGDMGYNALLGRPWIHLVRAVPSTMHQMLKFPTPEGIKTVRGEQRAAKEMFAVEESTKTAKAPDRTEGKNVK